MFNIGPQELVLILVLALLVVGPQRLPEIARSIGKGMRELRKAQDEVRKTIQVNLDEPSTAKTRSPRRLPVETDAAATTDGKAPTDAPGPTEATPSETAADDLTPSVAATTAASAVVAEPETTGVGEVSRTLGRTLAELRRAREEVQRSFRIDADPPTSRSQVADRSASRAAPAETAATPSSDETPTAPDIDAPPPRPAPGGSPASTEASAPDGDDVPSVAAAPPGDELERPA